MAVKKSRKLPSFEIYSLSDSALAAVGRDTKFSTTVGMKTGYY